MKLKLTGNNFSERVYRLTKLIPKGKISTYEEIAKKLNCKAYRAVGNALNKNPYAPLVPCHRIIKSSGEIGGFASGTKNKIKLLEGEGIKIKDNKVVDFKDRLYKF